MGERPANDHPGKQAAAEVLAQGGNQSSAARAAGVHRSTVQGWLKQDAFQVLVASLSGTYAEEADRGLAHLVPQAIQLLEDAINERASVSSVRARLALDIVKAAASLTRGEKGQGGDLAKRLDELAQRDPTGVSD